MQAIRCLHGSLFAQRTAHPGNVDVGNAVLPADVLRGAIEGIDFRSDAFNAACILLAERGHAPVGDGKHQYPLASPLREADGTLRGYGVDHQAVVEGLGCKALRVTDPEQLQGALRQAQQMAAQHRVPVVVECILERVTNIAMGTEIDKITEFEAVDCRAPQGLETVGLLD